MEECEWWESFDWIVYYGYILSNNIGFCVDYLSFKIDKRGKCMCLINWLCFFCESYVM